MRQLSVFVVISVIAAVNGQDHDGRKWTTYTRSSQRSYGRHQQRGDQGPDQYSNFPDYGGDFGAMGSASAASSAVSIQTAAGGQGGGGGGGGGGREPIGGPNVCRSRGRTFCCPGW